MIDVTELLERADELTESLSKIGIGPLKTRIAAHRATRKWLRTPLERWTRRQDPTVQKVTSNVMKSREYRLFKQKHGMTDAQMRRMIKIGAVKS